MSTSKLLASMILAASVSALSACGGGSTPAPVVATTPAAAATPETVKLYEQTCHTCHSLPASGAPQLGDTKTWAPRMAEGRETLLNHAINGYKSMPPMGTCTQCTEEQFAALIEYMSGAQLK